MKLNWISTLLLSGLFGTAGIVCADPITYTYTPISVPGSSSTVARGINNAGEIVGTYNDSAGQGHGFIYTNGAYTTVDAPGGTATALLGVNNLGQIVGTYRDSSNTQRLFLDNNSSFTAINPPGGISTAFVNFNGGILAGINDLGQIAGTTTVPGVLGQGFVYSNGQFSYVPYVEVAPATNVYFATGINNAGQVLLTQYNGIDAVGFIYSNGTLTTVPGADNDNVAYGINNAGDVVGVYGGNSSGGFLYSGGTLTKFDSFSPPYPSSRPILNAVFSINDKGQLIGFGGNGAVLATPNTAATPEPSSFVLLGCGLSGLAFLVRDRRKKAQA